MKILLFLFFLSPVINIFSASGQAEKILVFSKTAGFRHESIPAGIAALKKIGVENNFSVYSTEDGSVFNIDSLQQYKTVVFLSTTGDILDSLQQFAFESYIKSGGGFVGIHAASDTEYDWPWYGRLVGAYFKSHPAIQSGTVKVSDHVHPSTVSLPYSWERTDEWYDFQDNPRGRVHVLATLDEKSYTGGTMGVDHPIAWCHTFDGGKAWYTGGGHTSESYQEKEFLDHIAGGLLYTTGRIKGDFDATVNTSFDITVLDASPVDPLALEILPDLSVLYIERAGAIKIIDQKTGRVEVAGKINVNNTQEDGMLGVALDPDFINNNWIYLFYSPQGNISEQHVSRFTLNNNRIDFNSEKILLKIPTQREECCHAGGALEFDSRGNLYISVGDNTNPFDSEGFSPIDERAGRKYWDAQRTAANTKDLRGKILRIKPTAEGSYSIPEGNLFSDTSSGLPEIYIMGCRNPYRISVDKSTDLLYWGEVGPDAHDDIPARGPKGYDEINRTSSAGNFGWPYCIGNNLSYVNYDFDSLLSGSSFDCVSPENLSPNNTGLHELPPARPAWIWYPYSTSQVFPEFGEGARTAMVGGVYLYDSSNASEIKFPPYYHNKLIIYDWARDSFFEVATGSDGEIIKISPILTGYSFSKPIDMTFGPDGAVYVAQWGTGFWGGNPDAKILKIGFIQNGRSPKPEMELSETQGQVPLTITLSAKKSSDPDPWNKSLFFSWDFDGDGIAESEKDSLTYTFNNPGTYEIVLKVTDSDGKFSFLRKSVTAGNTAPKITILWPPDGGMYDWGDTVVFNTTVADLEEGSIEEGEILCASILSSASIGHNTHAHNISELKNCKGSFPTISHGDAHDNVFYVFNASYRDNGANNANNSLTGSSQSILRPKKLYASFYDSIKGAILFKPDTLPNEGPYIASIEKNAFLSFNPVSFYNIDFVTFRAGAISNKGFIEMRLDSSRGKVINKIRIDSTGNKSDFFSMEIPEIIGTHVMYITFSDSSANLNRMDFYGKGVSKQNVHTNTGVIAHYTNYKDTSVLKRKEPMIAFNWESGAPLTINDTNRFAIEWNGNLIPLETGNYQFQTLHNNGNINFSINDTILIENKKDSIAFSQEIYLIKDNPYKIKVKYEHTYGNAKIFLKWKSPSLTYFNAIHTDFLRIPDFYTEFDCNGDLQGVATIDSCGNCIGGRTSIFQIINENNCINGVEYPETERVFVVNPVTKKTLMFTTDIMGGDFDITSVNGSLVKHGNFKEGINEIDCSSCTDGIYFIRLISKKGEVYLRKISVQN